MMLVQHIVPNQSNCLWTCNDNLSNRSQKGTLLLSDSPSAIYIINSNGYASF